MKTMQFSWTLPTTRQQGGSLNPIEIRGVELELSADAGVNFTPVGEFPPAVLETTVADLPFSDQYVARARCIDITDQAGDWTTTPFVVSDTSPPGAVLLDIADA